MEASRETLAEAVADAERKAARPDVRVEEARWLSIVAGFVRGQRLRPEWRDPYRRRLLALADGITLICVIAVLALDVHGSMLAIAAVGSPLALVLAKIFGLYDRDHRLLRHLTVDEIPAIFLWVSALVVVLLVLTDAAKTAPLGMEMIVRLWITAVVAAVAFRGLARAVWRRTTPREQTAIIGTGALAAATARKLELFPDIHVTLSKRLEALEAVDFDSPEWLDGIDRVIVASEFVDEGLIAVLVGACRRRGIKLSIVPPARGMFGTAMQLTHIADLAVIDYNTWEVGPSTFALKRGFDLALAPLALVLAAPLFLVAAIAIKLDSRGPVFFTQLRVGRNRKPFRMFKFRTMCPDAERLLPQLVVFDELREPMFKLPDDPRVTRVGRILRRMSLDELPQLLNVLLGHMSMVGPRPEQVDLVERYAPQHLFRLNVKPGLTGPMQVYGRNALSFEERLAVEREYIENLSIARDLRILGLTLGPLLTGRGAS